ncbi:MAG: flagellar filament capping protein FliD [Synergistaceae bacterium]|nr:flagellar filament capping protein FliD [Synergistaceae bacterium]
MSNMSISGIVSGIDWDAMVEKMIENAKRPAYVQLVKKDNLELKKSLYEEFLISLRSLQSTLSPLRLVSTFKAKEVIIDRMDSNGSYRAVLNATANADAQVGSHDIEVLQLARAQINRSISLGGSLNSLGSPPVNLGADSYFYVYAAGQKVRIDVSRDDTAESLAGKINAGNQSVFPPIKMSAMVVDDRLVLKSDDTGTGRETVTATVNRSVSGMDTVAFLVNPDEPGSGTYTLNLTDDIGGINGGELRISNGSTVLEQGVHFDIINGNEIYWYDFKHNFPPPGGSYKVTYTATADDRFDINVDFSKIVRETVKDEDIRDKNVLPFDIISHHAGSASINDGTTDYYEGIHFKIEGRDIVWLEEGGKTPPTNNYIIAYHCAAGDRFSFDAKRNNMDSVDPILLPGGGTRPIIIEPVMDGTTVVTQPDTVVIRHGGVTFRQGVDFEVKAVGSEQFIEWKELGYAPMPGASYSIEVYDERGIRHTYSSSRDTGDAVSTPAGFNRVGGSAGTFTDVDYLGAIKGPLSDPDDLEYDYEINASTGAVTWHTRSPMKENENIPRFGADVGYRVEYTYNKSTFRLDDTDSNGVSNGILGRLGFDRFDDPDHFTEAQDAQLRIGGEDGRIVTSFSNNIGEGYGNPIEGLEGITLELRGTGRVIVDIEHDVNPAVDAINAFLNSYNDVMRWINTRLTEKEVDDSTKSRLGQDDVRWKWGLLNGDSLLRSAKDNFRRITSQPYVPTFSKRTGTKSIYGTMSQNGITREDSFTVTVGIRTLRVPVRPTDTIQDIATWINAPFLSPGEPDPPSDSVYDYIKAGLMPPGYENNGFVYAYVEAGAINGVTPANTAGYKYLNPLYFDPEGRQYPQPFATAHIVDNMLEIREADSEVKRPVRLGGSNAALTALGLNYEYTTLSQVGVKLPSAGQGVTEDAKIGILEFNTTTFMEAMKKDPDDVALLFNAFSTEMDNYLNELVKSSQKEVSGVTMVEGAVPRAMSAIDDQIRSIDRYLDEFEKRLQRRQKTLFDQFAQAEVAMSKLMEQAAWLASVTAQLQAQQASQMGR